MYSERLLDHFRNPGNVGELAAPAFTVEVTNPACGDVLRLSARLEGEWIVEARYKARGCTPTVAAGSALTGWLTGRSRGEAALLAPADIEELLGGLEPESKHAASLSVDAVRALLRAAFP